MTNFGFSDNEKEIMELLTKIAGIKKLIIYDERTKINALANVLKALDMKILIITQIYQWK